MQEAALELILIAEERIKSRDFVDRFKLALVGHDPATWVPRMFPQWPQNQEETAEVQYEYVKDIAVDDTTGTWMMPELTQEEREKMLMESLANTKGTFTIDDFDDDDGEGWI